MRGILLLLSIVTVAGCRPGVPSRPNVVLVVVDTLRADALGCYGNPRAVTPFLDRWADEGMRFAHAYAASSWTMPSVASLLTSRYPTQHKVTSIRARLASDETTLADVLRREGYATGGFSANRLVTDQLAESGFESFRPYGTAVPGRKLAARPLIRKALGWVDEVQRATPERPIFAYFQFMEPHSPYQPPEPYRSRFAAPEPPAARLGLFHMRYMLEGGKALSREELTQLRYLGRDVPAWRAGWMGSADVAPGDFAYARSLYDGEVASLDAELRHLFAELDRRGILRHAVVVFTADHGEEFGEHGLFNHGTGLYNELIHVPLVIVSDGIPTGTATQAVSALDVAPTVLDLAGIRPEPTFEGRSLAPLATRGEHSVDVVSELLETFSGGVGLHSEAVVHDNLKILALTREHALAGTEVYDLRADPAESASPTPVLWARAVPLLASLHSFTATIAPRARKAAPTFVPTDQARDRLRALGYVAD